MEAAAQRVDVLLIQSARVRTGEGLRSKSRCQSSTESMSPSEIATFREAIYQCKAQYYNT